MSSFLKSVLCTARSCQFLLIEDTFDGNCDQLLLYLIKNITDFSQVSYVSCNFNDFNGLTATNFDNVIKSPPHHVIINSLNSIIVDRKDVTYSKLCRKLYYLIDNGYRITCVLHTDLIPKSDRKIVQNLFRYMANVILKCYANDSLVKVTKINDNGKICKEKETYSINIVENRLETKKVILNAEPKKVTSNKVVDLKTTFKIDLNQNEKEVKKRLELPFYRQQKSSEIVYEPDENDDLDFEDPDDDLDV